MKLQLVTILVFLSLVMSMTARSRSCPDEIKVSKQDQHEAQQIARRFVKQMQEKRDVCLLPDSMFVANFTSHFVSDEDTVPRSVYSGLTTQERQRLFIAQTNAAYFATLDVLSRRKENTSEEDRYQQAFSAILPPVLADKLRTAVWPNNEFKFSSIDELQKRLPQIEKALADARNYLIANSIEQSDQFQKKLGDTVTGTGTKYRVRAYIGGDQIHDCEPLIGFPEDQVFFRVETPLQMGLVLIREAGQMKIIRITDVDDD